MGRNSIALGAFDGFHKGHMAVIEKARESDFPLLVLLFNEHPLKVLKGKAPPKLMTYGVFERICAQKKLNCRFIDFSEVCNMTPEQFFFDILVKELNAGEITCGENYTFGKGGAGNCETLSLLCEKSGIKLNTVETVKYKGEPVSSTRIRRLIENGEMEEAAQMLSRPFSYSLEVISGDRIGRKLNFPTANQIIPDDLVQMKHGVYASAVKIGSRLYPAVTNFGSRPTVNGKNLRSETYIEGFSGDLYGKNAEVMILKYLRSEKKFGSTAELSAAINEDCKKSVGIFYNALEKLQ